MLSFAKQVLKGAQAEVDECKGLREKLQRVAKLGGLLVGESSKGAGLVWHIARSQRLHRALPDAAECPRHPPLGVVLHRDIPYGVGPRTLLDVYQPAYLNFHKPWLDSGSAFQGHPVVYFCHGGVWASGDKEHFAALGTRLAQEGMVVFVVQYTLYPSALVPQMVEEVQQGLVWVMDHAGQFGGDPQQVTVVGHSAGAHLGLMALLKMAAASAEGSSNLGVLSQFIPGRHPAMFVGMAGVYDIPKHYELERARGVNKVSTMGRAMGGPAHFLRMSPTYILQTAQHHNSRRQQAVPGPKVMFSGGAGGGQGRSCGPGKQSVAYYKQFELVGEAIPRRCGLDNLLASKVTTNRLTGDPADSPSAGGHNVMGGDFQGMEVDTDSCPAPFISFPPAAAQSLPVFVLMSSCTDHMIPWHEAAELTHAVTALGGTAKHLIYRDVAHNDFFTAWPLRRIPIKTYPSDLEAAEVSRPSTRGLCQGQGHDGGLQLQMASAQMGSWGPLVAPHRQREAPPADLRSFGRDLLKLVRGDVQVRSRKQPPAQTAVPPRSRL